MSLKFKLGQKVIVNTGGADSVAFIDYPNTHIAGGYAFDWVRQSDVHGEPSSSVWNGPIAYLCRFTDDYSRTLHGGALSQKDFQKLMEKMGTVPTFPHAETNAQFIGEENIRAFVSVFEDMA